MTRTKVWWFRSTTATTRTGRGSSRRGGTTTSCSRGGRVRATGPRGAAAERMWKTCSSNRSVLNSSRSFLWRLDHNAVLVSGGARARGQAVRDLPRQREVHHDPALQAPLRLPDLPGAPSAAAAGHVPHLQAGGQTDHQGLPLSEGVFRDLLRTLMVPKLHPVVCFGCSLKKTKRSHPLV